MNDEQKYQSDAGLEDLFERARAHPPALPPGLLDSVTADAQALQPLPPSIGWQEWLRDLGGFKGVGGLVSAACVGVWIGVAPPQNLPDVTGLIWGPETVAETSDFGWDIEEG